MFGYNIAHKTMTPTLVHIVPKKHLSTLHQTYFRHIQEYPSRFKAYSKRRQIWLYGVTLKPMLTSLCATNIVWSIHEDKSKTSRIRPTQLYHGILKVYVAKPLDDAIIPLRCIGDEAKSVWQLYMTVGFRFNVGFRYTNLVSMNSMNFSNSSYHFIVV